MDDLVISVICTNNRSALESCLRALPEAARGLRWTTTVVDNASTDGTSELVREAFPWATLIRNDVRMGFSANHNKTLVPAVEEHAARYVLFLNDDTILDPSSLTAMVAEMDERHDIGALGPAIRGTDGKPQVSLIGFPSPSHLVISTLLPGRRVAPLQSGHHGWLNGSCVMVRPEAFRDIGPLDERFFIFFEDTDLGRRLLDAGWHSAISRDAGMIHLEHSTVSMPALNSIMARQMLRSQWLYVRKHNGRVRAAIVAGLVRVSLLLRAAKAFAVGTVGSRDEERAAAGHMVALASYSPADPLAHETTRT